MVIPKPRKFYLKTTTRYFQDDREINFNDVDFDNFWYKQVFDNNNNEIYCKNARGEWYEKKYDVNNEIIYVEHSEGDYYRYENNICIGHGVIIRR